MLLFLSHAILFIALHLGPLLLLSDLDCFFVPLIEEKLYDLQEKYYNDLSNHLKLTSSWQWKYVKYLNFLVYNSPGLRFCPPLEFLEIFIPKIQIKVHNPFFDSN